MKIKNYLIVTATTLFAFSGSLQAQLFVNLGTAADYVTLAKTGISTTSATSVVGDLGVSPAALTTVTGFSPILHSSGQYATSSLVTGKIFAADMGGPTAVNLTTAVLDMQNAYTQARNIVTGSPSYDYFLNVSSGLLNGNTLTKGLYDWNSAVTITNSVTLDGGGDSNAVWVFRVDNRFDMATGASMVLSNGADAANIYWVTAGGATIGTNADFKGNILTTTDIAVQTGATVLGRLLAQTAVTLDGNSVTVVSAIPEPSSYAALLGLGALTLVASRRRVKR